MKKTEKQVRDLTKDKWTINLQVMDKSADALYRANEAIKGISNKTFNFTMKMTDLATKPLRGLFNMGVNSMKTFADISGVSFGLKDTISTYQNFEQTMANVRAITRSNDTEFKELTQTAKELGKTTVFSSSEVAKGMTYLGMAGWDKDSIVKGLLGILNLASAGQADLATTANITSDVMTAFGIDPKLMHDKDNGIDNVTHFADVLTSAVTGSNTDIPMLGNTMKYTAPIARNFSMSLEETTAISGMMVNGGIKDSQAGSTLSDVLMRFSTKPKEAKEELERFKIALSDSQGKLRPIASIVADLGGAFEKLSKEEKLASAGRIFGTTGSSGWVTVINQGEEKLREFTKVLEDSNNIAKDSAEIQNNTLQGSFKRIQSAVEGVKIGIGEKLSPSLRDFTEFIVSHIPTIDTAINKTIDIVFNKINDIKSNFNDLTNGISWKYAESLSEKIELAWDKIIVEPFTDWWNGSGQQFVSDVANKIGSGLGNFYKSGIDLILGNGVNGADSLIGIGKSFADGFLKGFDVENTGKKVIDGIKNSFKNSFFNLSADKEDKSPVNTMLSGFMLYKSISTAIPVGKSLYDGGRLVKDIIDLAKPHDKGALAGDVIKKTPTPTAPAGTPNGMGTGLAGVSAEFSKLATAGMSSGAIPLAGVLTATGGVVSAFNDFTAAYKSINKKDRIDNLSKGITKSSMLGSGALVGSLLGGPVGTIVGAGIGGLGSLLFGDFFGTSLSDSLYDPKQIDGMIDSLKKAEDQANKISLKNLDVDNAIKRFEELDRIVKDGKAPIDDRNEAERLQEELVGKLADKYPELIGLYETENGKLSDNLDYMKNIAEMEKANALADIKDKALELSLKIPDLEATMTEEQGNIDRLSKKKAKKDKYIYEYVEAKNELESYVNQRAYLDIEGVDRTSDRWTKIDEGIAEVVQKVNEIKIKNGESKYRADPTGDGRLDFDVGVILEDLNKYIGDYRSITNDLDKSQERFDEAKKQYEEIFELNKKAIEQAHGLDGSIADNLSNLVNLSDAEKNGVNAARDEIEELIKTMDKLDKEYYLKVFVSNPEMLSKGSKALGEQGQFWKSPNEKLLNLIESNFYTGNNLKENYATGGILTKPHLGLVAEAGPEAIIPLSGSNRERGKQLWLQSGHILGIIQEHATGGIFGNIMSKCYVTKQDTEPLQNNNVSDIKAPISINLGGVNITIEGNTDPSDGKSIVKSIKEQMPTITNDLCEQMANMLNKVFSNMTMEAQ